MRGVLVCMRVKHILNDQRSCIILLKDVRRVQEGTSQSEIFEFFNDILF